MQNEAMLEISSNVSLIVTSGTGVELVTETQRHHFVAVDRASKAFYDGDDDGNGNLDFNDDYEDVDLFQPDDENGTRMKARFDSHYPKKLF